MDINIRYIGGKHIEIIFTEDNVQIEVGLLDKEEAKRYLDTFKDTVSELEEFIGEDTE